MQGRYVKIATRIWRDEKIKTLSKDEALMYLYVLTSPHSNMAGYYVLPEPYITYDLGWDPETVTQTLSKLLQKGLINRCPNTSMIHIPRFLKYNPVQNKNQAKGINNRLKELPSTPLIRDFFASARMFAKVYYDAITESIETPADKPPPETLSKPFRNPLETVSNTDTDSDTDSDTGTNTSLQLQTKLQPDQKFEKGSHPVKYTSHFIDKLLQNNPRTKTPPNIISSPQFQKWAEEIDRLNRIGPPGGKKGYSWNEIKSIIDWTMNDNFWSTVVLSPKKLREKVISIENKMKNPTSKPKNSWKQQESQSKVNSIKNLANKAKEEDSFEEI